MISFVALAGGLWEGWMWVVRNDPKYMVKIDGFYSIIISMVASRHVLRQRICFTSGNV